MIQHEVLTFAQLRAKCSALNRFLDTQKLYANGKGSFTDDRYIEPRITKDGRLVVLGVNGRKEREYVVGEFHDADGSDIIV